MSNFLSLRFGGLPVRCETRGSGPEVPSTPGRLGYMMVVRLMDLGRFCSSKCSINFYKYWHIFSSRARLTDGSLIEQTAL